MRQPRHLVESAWYHVTVRANRREMFLDRGEVRDLFLVFLARARKRCRSEVSNSCVMGNMSIFCSGPAKARTSRRSYAGCSAISPAPTTRSWDGQATSGGIGSIRGSSMGSWTSRSPSATSTIFLENGTWVPLLQLSDSGYSMVKAIIVE